MVRKTCPVDRSPRTSCAFFSNSDQGDQEAALPAAPIDLLEAGIPASLLLGRTERGCCNPGYRDTV